MFEVPSTPVLLVDGSRESQREISHAPYTVGRKPGSDILLEDAFVSRKHAEIVFENGSFYIVDQGSKHGTYRKRAPVKAAQALESTMRFTSASWMGRSFGSECGWHSRARRCGNCSAR